MKNKEFIELIDSGESPETLFELAETPYQKAVVIVLYKYDTRMKVYEKDVSWLKKITTSTFGIVLLAMLAQYLAPWFQSLFV